MASEYGLGNEKEKEKAENILLNDIDSSSLDRFLPPNVNPMTQQRKIIKIVSLSEEVGVEEAKDVDLSDGKVDSVDDDGCFNIVITKPITTQNTIWDESKSSSSLHCETNLNDEPRGAPKNYRRSSVYNDCRKRSFEAEPVPFEAEPGLPAQNFFRGKPNAKESSAPRLIINKKLHSAKYPTYNVKRENQRSVFSINAEFKGWWHMLISAKLGYAVALIFATYIVIFIAFAPIYMAMDERCGLHLDGSEFSFVEEDGETETWHDGKKFLAALYLSTETMTTIGYGVPDPYYNGCPEGIIVIMIQALIGFMMNAVLFGTVFARISRAQRRALSVVFSPKACIREIKGRFFLVTQVCEARREQVINGGAFMYVALQDKSTHTPYVVHNLRTIRPDDTLNQELLLCLPNSIVHEIDGWSPLAPPNEDTFREGFEDTTGSSYDWPFTRQRLDDCTNGNRAAYVCLVCGQTFMSVSTLRRHVSYEAIRELKDMSSEENPDPKALCLFCGEEHDFKDKLAEHIREKHYADRVTDQAFNEHWMKGSCYEHANCYTPEGYRQDGYRHVGPHMFTREEIKGWMAQCSPEVIVSITATDCATGSAFNAQHSWKGDEEIVWDRQFVRCVTQDGSGRGIVDFKKFADTEPAPPVLQGEHAGFVQFHL